VAAKSKTQNQSRLFLRADAYPQRISHGSGVVCVVHVFPETLALSKKIWIITSEGNGAFLSDSRAMRTIIAACTNTFARAS
jgi:hypothetical protein